MFIKISCTNFYNPVPRSLTAKPIIMCERKCKHKYYPCVTHCIFDLDGTLLDTERIYAGVFTKMLEERGANYTQELHKLTKGATSEKCWELLAKECHLKEKLNDLVKEFRKRSYDLLENTSLMPGAAKLVFHLHAHKIPIAVATSSSEEMYSRKIAPHKELFDSFHHVICGGSDPSVTESKPNPDIFLVCAEKFEENPCPTDCLVFEDSPNGVLAARRAGMQCVAIVGKGISREGYKPATLILESLEEFAPEHFGLPCFFTTKDDLE